MPVMPPDPPPGNSWRSMMDVAFQEACKAASCGETPIGAALFTAHGELIAKAFNQPISENDPTGHAEVICLRKAAQKIGNYRLNDTIMAITLEPCLMCTGALIHARVAGIVIGVRDPKAGAFVSNLDGADLSFTNHKLWFVDGIMKDECKGVLTRFFLEKRKQ